MEEGGEESYLEIELYKVCCLWLHMIYVPVSNSLIVSCCIYNWNSSLLRR